MKKAFLIFPHQLFESNFEIIQNQDVFLIEEYLFFSQYKFHKQKLVFHRASMKGHEVYLNTKTTREINYIEATDPKHDIRLLLPFLIDQNYTELTYIDPTDNYLSKRIHSFANQIRITEVANPSFLNAKTENSEFFKGKKRMFQTEFYISQRKKFKILIDEAQSPIGGQWSFDADNRKKYPAKKTPPVTFFENQDAIYAEAVQYVETNFGGNLGQINTNYTYPSTYEAAQKWLDTFLQNRFAEFGEYEDAIVKTELVINHSLLSPLINAGLLNPAEVIEKTLAFAQTKNIPLNSTEGFVRQVIGWREFIRAVYELKGGQERSTNFWKFKRKIPASFYTGTTGIEPIDLTIKKVLATGYCHHIERLMILGNFMLLCEFDPDEVYRWFMELFIDAYDWVMVPNVYGMSQFADGGLMSTKPYFSGSNYIMKMSDYPKGIWQVTWDALFWRFMNVNRLVLKKNPRLAMLISTYDKMADDKKANIMADSTTFLMRLED
jgi:deoxyribodipyrimidine photolyase-related protein